MAVGRPVVTADTPAVREVLRDGVDALLVPADDPAALARRCVAWPTTRSCARASARPPRGSEVAHVARWRRVYAARALAP